MSVTELPTGKYDAARTLRHLLAQAEAGRFNHVLVICDNTTADAATDEIWATWSDMDARDVWWMAGWFVGYLRRRYFSGKGLVNEESV